MNKESLESFTENINKITAENNSILLYHRTSLKNLENILKDGALLPPKERKSLTNYEQTLSNYSKKVYENYINSVFLAVKIPSFELTPRIMGLCRSKWDEEEGYGGYGKPNEAFFLFNPYDIDDEVFKNSHFSKEWNYGRKYGVKNWMNEKDKIHNFKRIEKFMKRYIEKDKNLSFIYLNLNELVIKNPKGINFSDILKVNPKGVMIVIKTETNGEEYKNLIEKYSEYQWVLIDSK